MQQTSTPQSNLFENNPCTNLPLQIVPGLSTPELKDMVTEASRALANLDLNRLEELARSCEALNRDIETFSQDAINALALQARRASADMAVFARVLDATRSNLRVMRRLDQLHAQRLEYKPDDKEDLVSSSPQILNKGSIRGLD